MTITDMALPEILYVDKLGVARENRVMLDDVCYKVFPHKMHKFPTSFQCTDAVIIRREEGKLLLGKKPKQKAWRFIGGFVDPADKDLETGCRREIQEEVGIDLEVSHPEYLFSFRVSDPRYADKSDKIMSAVFKCYHLWGRERAGDDIAKVRWFTKDYIRRSYKKMVMVEHHPIVEGLIARGIL